MRSLSASFARVVLTITGFIIAASSPLPAGTPLFPNPGFTVGKDPRLIKIADMNADGRQDIVVANRLSASLTVILGRGDGSFEPARTTPLPGFPTAIAIADLGNDGWLDLAVSTSIDIVFLYGTSNGGFSSWFSVGPLNGTPNDLVMSDFNGDGRNDLAAVSSQSKQLSIAILPANAPMQFTGRYDAGSNARAVATADFDRNGTADLVVYGLCASGDPDCPIGGLFVFLGHGDGSFSPLPAVPVDDWLGRIVAADVDDDGLPDVVISAQSGRIILYQGRGDGTLGSPVNVDAGEDQQDVAAGDFNHDGHTDLAVANPLGDGSLRVNSGEVSILLGEGGGWFPHRMTLPAGGRPWGLAVGDFNHDASVDLAITKQGNNDGDVMVYMGRGDGSFSVRERIAQGGVPGIALAADLDGDELDEVVTHGAPLMVFKKGADGTYARFASYDTESFVRDIAAGDFNGDGRQDIVFVHGTPLQQISTFLGLGDGQLAPLPSLTGVAGMTAVHADDYNGDGLDDLVIAATGTGLGSQPDDTFVFLAAGGGSFAGPTTLHTETAEPCGIAGGDFNLDGHRDFAIGGSSNARVQIFLGNGAGTFASLPAIRARTNVVSLDRGDVDADGIEDLVLSTGEVLFGVGDGTFAVQLLIQRSEALLVSDFNLDGHDDIAALTNVPSSAANLWIRLAAAGRTFVEPMTFWGGHGNLLPGAPGQSLVVGRFDADRRIDLVLAFTPDDRFGGWILHNAGPQPDEDGDGVDNRDDPCTDTDGDGYGDPGFASNSCPADNCPRVANADQNDLDGDGIGDACDRCTDADHDGAGDPGFELNTCRVDNCPNLANGSQSDRDLDGLGDLCDPCTDQDGDGFGDPAISASVCPGDNCPAVPNPEQRDTDEDGDGDLCDACPLDPLNDWDRDGFCSDVDNCDDRHNPDQMDVDLDGRGDACDNCPSAANSDQIDSNDDGDGDACQPSLEIVDIAEDGGETLEVTIALSDPQDEPLNGVVEIHQTRHVSFTLPNVFIERHCGAGFFPTGTVDEGFAFAFISGGTPSWYLMDLHVASLQYGFWCGDATTDFEFGWGRCDNPATFPLTSSLRLPGTSFPVSVCAFDFGTSQPRFDITLFGIGSFLDGEIELPSHQTIPFAQALPRSIGIWQLTIGGEHQLSISVTDGNTLPLAAERSFLYQGESILIFNHAPLARVIAEPTVECDRPEGALVVLDGSVSSDVDSTPGTGDDLASFEWYEDFDLPTERSLGTGPLLTITLPLGVHRIALRVTDQIGAVAMAEKTVTVRDSKPPDISVITSPSHLWPPNHRMVPIEVSWEVNDLCDEEPSVRLISVNSNESPSDPVDDSTIGDISGADTGFADHELSLRAARSASGPGRVYELHYLVTDGSGNQSPAIGKVAVPHDLGVATTPRILPATRGEETTGGR